MPFQRHAERALGCEPNSADRRVFMCDHVVVDGTRLPYMEMINYFVNKHTGDDNFSDGSFRFTGFRPENNSIDDNVIDWGMFDTD